MASDGINKKPNTSQQNNELQQSPVDSIVNVDHSQGLRYNMVLSAVKFLTHPTIVSNSEESKINFLKDKGLLDSEIQLAFDQVRTLQTHGMGIPQFAAMQPLHMTSTDAAIFRFRNLLNTLATLGGVAYGVYWVYKKYIQPYFFVQKKEKTFEQSVSETCNALKESLITLQSVMEKMQSEMSAIRDKQVQTEYSLVSDMKSVKSELATLKGLLLNKSEFPPIIATEPLLPSIPDWQLSNGNASKSEKDKIADINRSIESDKSDGELQSDNEESGISQDDGNSQ